MADEEAAFAARCAAAEASARTLDVLGGVVSPCNAGACFVVERRYPAHHQHGSRTIGGYHSAVRQAAHALPWFLAAGNRDADRALHAADSEGPGLLGGLDPMPRLVFFDLETTGLSGGAGTYAFLVGCAFFEDDALVTRQFLLRGYGEEKALLHTVRDFVSGLAATDAETEPILVTYNGRTFDLPLIDIRFQMHRVASPFEDLAHVDMLFPARRLWRRRLLRVPPPEGSPDSPILPDGDARASCSLTALEQDILGLSRHDDVPGWEIPQRFFVYARTGDASGLAGVMEHNRLDLVSLAAVTSRILEMAAERGHGDADRHECLARARLYEYLGQGDAAERCYSRAADPEGVIEGHIDRQARAEALHWLALRWRRARRFSDAAEAWAQVAAIPGIDRDLRREALEALAIHHEHRAKDLSTAQAFALQASRLANSERSEQDLQHRLGRLSRKLGDTEGRGLQRLASLDSSD